MALRLDTVQEMDPGFPEPCGTKAELKRAKLPLLRYGSCSLPGRANRGCQHFDHPQFGPCPIRALLAKRSRPGPENVGFVQIKSPTIWKRDTTTCHNFMATYAHQDSKSAQFKILAIGGDPTVLNIRGSEEKDPGNPKTGMKTVFTPTKVEKFLRPEERFAERLDTLKLSEEIAREEQIGRGEALAHGLDDIEQDELGVEMADDDFDDGKPVPAEEETDFEAEPADDEDFESAEEPEPALIAQITAKPKRGKRAKPAEVDLDGL